MPLHEIAETATELGDLLGARGRRLREAVGNETSDAGRLRALEAELLRRLNAGRPGRSPAPAMVREILVSRGHVRVGEMASRAGLSRRQLERRFLAEAGLSPKSLARLVRFQSVFDAVARRQAVDWADVASDCGYSDQAHLIREFRAFSGETPVTLHRSQGQLSRRFTSPERLRAFFGAG